jgi:hypothetical protein
MAMVADKRLRQAAKIFGASEERAARLSAGRSASSPPPNTLMQDCISQ